MIEFNSSAEMKRSFPDISHTKLGQLLLLCTCILAVQSTNLRQCAKRVSKLIGKEIKLETAYSRLKRFFQTGESEKILKGICILVIRTMCQHKECYLILDRTNWEFGKCKINLLVIGLLYKNVFIPLVWKDLEKKGNSNTKERLDLMDRLLNWWPKDSMKIPQLYLAGDREFIGYKWLRGLEKRDIKFVMRIRANSKIVLWFKNKIRDRKIGLKLLRRYLAWTGKESLEAVLESDYIVKICALENESTRAKAEIIYLMTNMEDIDQASILYKKRYKIEVCFKHMKKNGFNLEDQKVVGGHKSDLMFGALTVVYLMAVQKGLVYYEDNPQEMKLHRDKKKKSYGHFFPKVSIFNKGSELLLSEVFFYDEFCLALMKMSRWIAKRTKPLEYDHYTLQKISVQ